MALEFGYQDFIKDLTEDWMVEVSNVFRCLDINNEGLLSRDAAIHALKLFGIDGADRFHYTRKTVSLKAFIDVVQDERDRNKCDSLRRWKYLFKMIAGPENDKITVHQLQAFFTLFGHKPQLRYCEDFIDEFDRIEIAKTSINLDDWLMFCRIHKLPF